MDPAQIIYPMAALALLTTLVLMQIPRRRFKAGRERKVKTSDFLYGESANVPPEVSIPNRNYMNLLELPMLFYIVCLCFFVTQAVDDWALGLAWSYFVFRLCHSAVHLTYNKVMHRLVFFTLSNVVLVTMWIRLVVSLPG